MGKLNKTLKRIARLVTKTRALITRKDYFCYLPHNEKSLISGLTSNHYTHCLVLPWLNPGGAEREALHCLQALVELGAKPFVILTEPKASTWLHKIPLGVEYIQLGMQTAQWLQRDRIELLTRLLTHIKPAVIHNINSTLAWRAFKEHSARLAEHSHLYCSVFMDVITPNGKIWSHSRRDLPYCINNITAIISDNSRYEQLITKECNFPSKKFCTIYFPAVGSPEAFKDRSYLKKILWASRLDSEKRIDILARIAQKLPEFTFDIFGYRLFEPQEPALSLLETLSNVNFRGAYQNFSELAAQDYALFLFTSSNEGMPNVLLEAGLAGLPIVATAVGGVPELINNTTGYPIQATATEADYIEAIHSIIANPADSMQRAQALQQLIIARHSWKHFKESLLTIPGYLD